ncbi:MAG: Crp/Fnr family transcriptional regulator [Azoarcus sp.]|nr:Crp/Fnr family transcriptional regulator [Azoarcus sp.]
MSAPDSRPIEDIMLHKIDFDIDALLTGLPLFNGLSPEEISHIAQSMRKVDLGKGEILFRKGDECNGFHLLVSGQVKLAFISPQGQEKIVEIVRPRQTFGEAFMFMERAYGVFAQALTDAILLFFPKQAVFSELERDPALARKMIAGLSMRLHQLISDVEDYSLHSGRQRVIGYLLREMSDGADNAFTLRLTTGKNVIASRLSMTQEHLSRILHELTVLGLLVVHGREIHIPDIRKLREHED